MFKALKTLLTIGLLSAVLVAFYSANVVASDDVEEFVDEAPVSVEQVEENTSMDEPYVEDEHAADASDEEIKMDDSEDAVTE